MIKRLFKKMRPMPTLFGLQAGILAGYYNNVAYGPIWALITFPILATCAVVILHNWQEILPSRWYKKKEDR